MTYDFNAKPTGLNSKPVKPRAPKAKPKPKPELKPEPKAPVYVATRTCGYTFVCDGTRLRLTEGVAPRVTEAQLRELVRYKHVREVN